MATLMAAPSRRSDYVVGLPDNVWVVQIALAFTVGLMAGIICTIFSILTITGKSSVMPWSGWVGIGLLCYGVMSSAFVVVIEELQSRTTADSSSAVAALTAAASAGART